MPSTSLSAPSLSDVVARLGSGLAELVTPTGQPDDDPAIEDITLAEPEADLLGVPGDLVLGIGITTAEQARETIAMVAARGVRALALRRTVALAPQVGTAASSASVAIVAVADSASWAHVAWLLREVLDRAGAAPGVPGHEAADLFALADACTAILGGPVTIEDTHSRVLAYSERHEATDPIRVSTILGRRAPAAVVASLRARGVFRHLVRSDEPLFLPAAPDGLLGARVIVPVRVGPEWVGSIWAVVDAPATPGQVARLGGLAGLIALQLLRIRTESDVGRRLTTERLRAALSGDAQAAALALPEPPWRVVLLGADPAADDEAALAFWESSCRRASWQRPHLALLDGEIVAVVSAAGRAPGSWEWLRRMVVGVADAESWGWATASGDVTDAAGLAAAFGAVRELAGLRRAGTVTGVATTVDEAWAGLTVARAAAAVAAAAPASGMDPIRGDDALDPVLAQTLSAWLDHPGDPRGCAEALHVHPNTVRYRLGRIRAHLGLDLADPQVRLALSLAIRASTPRV